MMRKMRGTLHYLYIYVTLLDIKITKIYIIKFYRSKLKIIKLSNYKINIIK